jgi:hypothetical protein
MLATLVDVLQEQRCAGRWPTASPTINRSLVCLFLETYLYLLYCLANPSTVEYNSTRYKSILVADLQQTLEAIILPTPCLHVTLKIVATDPYASTKPSISDNCEPCGVNCSFCLGNYLLISPWCAIWEWSRFFLEFLLANILFKAAQTHLARTIS